MALLTARKATKRFGGLIAVDELDLEIKEWALVAMPISVSLKAIDVMAFKWVEPWFA
jgi:hypothetical protein